MYASLTFFINLGNQFGGIFLLDKCFLLQINKKHYGENREELMLRLSKNNIQTRPAWSPIHLQKPYYDCQSYKIEKSIELINNSLCIPSSTSLSKKDIQKVIKHLNV